jgi:hypothetical protein
MRLEGLGEFKKNTITLSRIETATLPLVSKLRCIRNGIRGDTDNIYTYLKRIKQNIHLFNGALSTGTVTYIVR